jgi:putative phosphoribosyl transferase
VNTYADRASAGRSLVDAVLALDLQDPIVLAVPPGGVPVGRPIADALGASLDVLLIRKVGTPLHREVGCGAVGEGGVVVLDEGRIDRLELDHAAVDEVVEEERAQLQRWVDRYRNGRSMSSIEGRDVVVVDDGVATGGSASAGVEVVRGYGPRRVVVVVPVAAAGGIARLTAVADHVICPMEVTGAFAVGIAYDDFRLPDEAEVLALLD